ncbi:bifunctional biotin--[acetyl-CoA-carboxylase] ligase/biotin operon repressor BirA [Pseudomonas syringae]|uniref:bifunctional biotin--[acetyl-CoA-carboxylase] ligase/biotin operon repressor BirA n=1 Tax=Pseudomonas syringae TaxID=317 RepID=UPI001372DDB9|nr:bifunctional biotin--[acetyl-CoA-carboxylase] ligase/biotin operon repressor BirA [Pseudomonas syringae]MDU8431835.1 bifunctional biotin--[acetyl-CoA-carboxylase] ligase/biotin operon repressor BirA [Pseudomonas syringae pv. actinidifoliorum]MDU8524476.1 bifunctional biotin--[acetyl-CoA-carboxylase] ligase/biotin operon repressor BirA [Pseudomonas syringae pv. actinidifoliorum]MDU8528802.1 bifunctional biotin--[acetyl-CoA-carboxylase] ligase/biotin operon repressor BirA [Pseudomonas syringae 
MLTLLKLLADGAFHSGQVLGESLGVSRSAVWKQLQQLESDLGIEVHKVRGRGYRLATPIVLLDPAAMVESGMPGEWSVRTYDSIDSTNAEASRLIALGAPMPLLVVAEQQTAGRGRRGRKWVSPYAENLYYSLVLRIDGGMRQLEGLSLLVGLAVMNVLRDMGVQGAGLKWPNDVLVGRQKIAGILLELIGDPADVCHVIIGIGVNVNMRASTEVDQLWTSVRLQTGAPADRNTIAARISAQLEALLAVHRQEGFSAFQKEWERGHLWQGAAVKLLSGVETVEGVVLGVDSLGALRLEVNGLEKSFSGGELSLRLRDDS